MRVEAAANGGEYKEVRTIETNGGAQAEEVALDAVLGVAGGPPCRDYTVRITGLDLIALTLRDVTLEKPSSMRTRLRLPGCARETMCLNMTT